MYENGGRKDGRQSIDGLCVVTKTNAWMCVGEKVEECLTIFGGRPTESGVWI